MASCDKNGVICQFYPSGLGPDDSFWLIIMIVSTINPPYRYFFVSQLGFFEKKIRLGYQSFSLCNMFCLIKLTGIAESKGVFVLTMISQPNARLKSFVGCQSVFIVDSFFDQYRIIVIFPSSIYFPLFITPQVSRFLLQEFSRGTYIQFSI